MKLLGNPWIVGGLCVIAAGVVGYQVLTPRSRAGASPAPPAGVSPAPTASVPPAFAPRPSTLSPQLSTTSTQATAPTTLIDRVYVRSHLAQWLEAPKRDPFLMATVGERGAVPGSPVSQWKLRAIWRQTGSRLAVINKGVYAEGDLIEGYRLEKVENDGVWLRGPTGREGLGFAKPQPAIAPPPRTNTTGR